METTGLFGVAGESLYIGLCKEKLGRFEIEKNRELDIKIRDKPP